MAEKKQICKIHYRALNEPVSLASLSEIFAKLENPSILGANNAGRFSYWAGEPVEIFEFNSNDREPFEKLQRTLDKYSLAEDDKNDLPAGIFKGGWIGYFGYELGRYIEEIPQTTEDDLKMPLVRLCFYDKVICYDSQEKICYLVALELLGEKENVIDKLGWLEKVFSMGKEKASLPILPDNKSTGQYPWSNGEIDIGNFKCNVSKEDYLKAFDVIRNNIYDGNVYQVNYSIRFEDDYCGEPIKLFGWQNRHNSCDYSAYISWRDFAIVSTSPEMFITIEDGVVSTKPIKGTRGRGNDSAVNKQNRDELLNCEKEQAELNMIIDLQRNDLGRICEPGSIKVVEARTIEEYPTVFHAVATVEGVLEKDKNFCDILKATFPGGSITGAPKISAMKIIDNLELTQRAVYTGSIGFIGIDGSVCLNIAIRTIIVKGGKAYAQVGSGIVADSDSEFEYNEAIIKAKALLAGIENTNGIL